MNLSDYIPSKQMRDYLEEQGVVFSDFEMATLIWNMIWNSPGGWDSRALQSAMRDLEELAARTTDERTRAQIQERLRYEEDVLAAFWENSGEDYLYVVEDSEECPRGYFTKGHAALSFAKQKCVEKKERYHISKQMLIRGDEAPMIRDASYPNPYLCGMPEPEERMCPYDAWYGKVAGLSLDAGGEIAFLWSNELSGQETWVDPYAPERFENHFFEIPYPFEIGDVVRVVERGKKSGRHGVVETSRKDWQDFMERVKHGLYVDDSDMCITVEFLTEDGCWSHDHINPIFLEGAILDPQREDALMCEAFQALSDYFRGGETPDQEAEVMRTCRAYAVAQRKESRAETAKRLQDILF